MLPTLPRTAVVLGALPGWVAGLRAAGVAVVQPGTPADLVVTTPVLAGQAAALGTPYVLVEGAVRRVPGMASRRYLALPDAGSPRFVIDPAQRHAAAYAGSLLPRLAKVAGPVLRAGVPLPGRVPSVTVGAREPGRPAVLSAAAALGAEPDGEWFLALGAGGVRRRAVFYVFPPGARRPAQVVKLGRVAGETAAFDRDERGLALARAAGPVVADKAPRLLGRGEAGGLPLSVETALPGRPMTKAIAEDVVGWLRAVARATAGPGPSVFRHGDVFPGNVVVDGTAFGLVDWEHADPAGTPLADLLFFAAHVAPLDSPTVRRWVREAARDLELGREQVRELAARTWRDHGERARASRLAREAATGEPVEPYLPERLADEWANGRAESWQPW